MRDHYEETEYYNTPHNFSSQYSGEPRNRALARPICVDSTHSSEVYHLRGDMPATIGCIMWIAASSPCCSVYTPIYAGNRGATPAEWMLGWDSFNPDSAWWTFEQVQRLVAPMEPDREFWQATWPHIRATWDRVERREFIITALVEKVAMKLWEYGEKSLACEVLTNYTYIQLHSNFLRARTLLNWGFRSGL